MRKIPHAGKAGPGRVDVPEFLLKRVLKRNSEQMIQQLQREIGAR
jgi:hypothetical protein